MTIKQLLKLPKHFVFSPLFTVAIAIFFHVFKVLYDTFVLALHND